MLTKPTRKILKFSNNVIVGFALHAIKETDLSLVEVDLNGEPMRVIAVVGYEDELGVLSNFSLGRGAAEFVVICIEQKREVEGTQNDGIRLAIDRFEEVINVLG